MPTLRECIGEDPAGLHPNRPFRGRVALPWRLRPAREQRIASNRATRPRNTARSTHPSPSRQESPWVCSAVPS